MSLPSKIIFYDIYDNRVGYVFCNCGWWVDTRSLFGCFDDQFDREEDAEKFIYFLKNSHSLELYDFTFFSEMILDYVKSERPQREELIKIFGEIYDKSVR